MLVIPGFILLISMTFLYSFLTTGTPYWFVILVYTIRMIALGLLVMPLNTVGLNALESDDVSHGTAIMNSLRIIAGAMGTAISVTILSIVAKQYTASHATMSKMKLTQEATVHGIDVAFIFTTVLIIVGFILALFIKEEKSLIIQKLYKRLNYGMNLGHKLMFQVFYNVKTAVNFWALTECISIDKAIWVSTLRE